MLRVLVLTSLVAAVGIAAPAAAFDIQVRDCTSLVLAFTESDETHVDFYVSEVVDYDGEPGNIDVTTAQALLAAAIAEAGQSLLDPGQVSEGDLVAQIEIQLPYSDDPEVTGLRFTYQVNVNACSGV